MIPKDVWIDAETLTAPVDPDDTPFVALALHLNAKLWTGDKTLLKGLLLSGFNAVIDTEEFMKLLRKQP